MWTRVAFFLAVELVRVADRGAIRGMRRRKSRMIEREGLMQLRPIEIDVEVFRFLGRPPHVVHTDTQRHSPRSRGAAGSKNNSYDRNARRLAIRAISLVLEGRHAAERHKTSHGGYNGRTHSGEIVQGAWHVGGAFNFYWGTPFRAARRVSVARSKKGQSGVSGDGWEYWEIQEALTAIAGRLSTSLGSDTLTCPTISIRRFGCACIAARDESAISASSGSRTNI